MVVAFCTPYGVTTNNGLTTTRATLKEIVCVTTYSVRALNDLMLVSLQLRTMEMVIPFGIRVIDSRLIVSLMFFSSVNLPYGGIYRRLSLRFFMFHVGTRVCNTTSVEGNVPIVRAITPMVGSGLPIGLIGIEGFVLRVFCGFDLYMFKANIVEFYLVIRLRTSRTIMILCLLRRLFGSGLYVIRVIEIYSVRILTITMRLFTIVYCDRGVKVFFYGP